MAEAKLIVSLVDKASAGIRGLGRVVDGLRQHWLAMAAGVASATAFLVASVRAFAEQEDAVKRLDTALKNQGITAQVVSKDLQAYATSLQSATVFGDEAIISGMALLTTFGLTGDALKRATAAAADLSTGMGIDLQSAMMLVGKAAQGQVEMLGRYGIKIREGLTGTQAFEAVLTQLGSRFGGSAQAQAETFSGKVIQLKNAFGDLQEEIGKLVVGPGIQVVGWFRQATDKAQELVSALKSKFNIGELDLNQMIARRDMLRAEVEESSRMFTSVQARAAATASEAAEIKALTDAINAKRQAQRAEIEERSEQGPGGVKAGPGDETEDRAAQERLELHGFELAEKARMEIEALTMTQEQREQLRIEAMARELEQDGQHETAKTLLQAREEQKRRTLVAERLGNAKMLMNSIEQLAGSKSKDLLKLVKGANVAEALMDTYKGATKALGQGGFFGFGMAAAVLAAGLANVSKISATPLAEGGIVLPRAGGTLARLGEAGQAEAVIPLGSPQAQRMAGGVSITIQAGVVVADRTSVAEFAGMIEEELYKRARNGKSLLDIV